MTLYCSFATIHGFCHFQNRFFSKIAQHEGFSLAWGKLKKGLLNEAGIFLLDSGLVRGFACGRVGDLSRCHARLLPIVEGTFALPLAGVIDTNMNGNPMKPGGKARLPRKSWKSAPGPDHGILDDIHGLIHVPHGAVGHAIDGIAMKKDEFFEGGDVPGLSELDEGGGCFGFLTRRRPGWPWKPIVGGSSHGFMESFPGITA
jgi:hypothetical protein